MPEVTLSTLSYGGDCLGRLPDGRVVFIPYGIPGETVAIEIVQQKSKVVRGEITRILESSPLRVEPRCIHYGVCGGCHFQHMTYAAQLEFKKEILAEQLVRVGKLRDFPAPHVIPSRSSLYYRNNIRFHVLSDGCLGFLAPHSKQIIPISECHLPGTNLNDARTSLVIDPGSGIQQVEIRCGTDGTLLITLEGGEDQAPAFETDAILSVTYASPGGRMVLAGDDELIMRVKEKAFKVSGGSFFQVNTEQAESMVEILLDHLELDVHKSVMDLYCGVGLFSAFIAPQVKEVIGVEASPSACRDYAFNLDIFDNVSLFESPVEKALPGIKQQADTIIIDPPRTGLHPKALTELMRLKPEQIAYVSCDPATLARDLSAMVHAGYQISGLFLLDLFPQTYHLETIAFLRPGSHPMLDEKSLNIRMQV